MSQRPQICLQQFRKTQRQPNGTSTVFPSWLTTSWDYYIKLRNVTDLEQLTESVVSDKICSLLERRRLTKLIKDKGNEFPLAVIIAGRLHGWHRIRADDLNSAKNIQELLIL